MSSDPETIISSNPETTQSAEDQSPEMPIVPQFVSLTEEQQTLLIKEAFTRIIETYRQANCAWGRDLRCSLLARLIAQVYAHNFFINNLYELL